jgi:hypothetical protein
MYTFEAHKDTLKALAALQEKVNTFEQRAFQIIYLGRAVTGRPVKGEFPSKVRVASRQSVFVQCSAKDAEGYCWDGGKITFPLRWMSMPDEEWLAELQALHAEAQARLVHAAEERKLRTKQKFERAERAELARLTAKYGTNSALG